MQRANPLSSVLRATALVVFIASLGTWFVHGARLGWTQTSVVKLQQDEVTGIEYPVRQSGFVAGIEVPVLGAIAAAGLGGLGLLARRRRAVTA